MFFLHGFNVSFEDAAITTAQLSYDLRIQPAIFFSWPSMGKMDHYDYDGQTIKASYDQITSFIKQLDSCAIENGTTINVIAHSMGNRALLKALEAIQDGIGGNLVSTSLDKLVFAAPDVDTRIFAQSINKIVSMGKRKTLYTSSKDKAVWASAAIVNKFDRAGFVTPCNFRQFRYY